MKKKGNKKPDAKKDEKPVDQKDIMAEINQYLKISETENKLKEKGIDKTRSLQRNLQAPISKYYRENIDKSLLPSI